MIKLIKLTALALCAVLAMAMPAMASAETYSVEVDYEGEFVTFDELFDLYLPDTFAEEEVTDEMYDNGIFACYSDETNGMAMSVQWVDGGGDNSLDAAYESMAANDAYKNVDKMTFNSIPFVVYDADGAFGCMCSDDGEGGYYIFTFAPDNEATSAMAVKIMASISEP